MSKIVPLLMSLCLFSCSTKKEKAPIGNIKRVEELLRYSIFQTENEKNLSFPILFNKNVLLSQGICSIKRKYYLIDSTEMISGKTLREERHYIFNKGSIHKMELFYFYDDRQVGRMRIGYAKKGFVSGFKEATIERDSGAVTDKEFMEAGFQVHEFVKKQRRFSSYKEKTSGTMLFFMINKAYWGALSIDSILHPSPVDRVVLGSALYPFKSYSVENKVKESNVCFYTYHPYLKRIHCIITEDFPFSTTRTFFYDKEGYCTSYIDSTFSSEEFLLRTASRITLNSKKLPMIITHKKETAFRKLGVTSIEKFEYQYER
jgi:hypothetical protein